MRSSNQQGASERRFDDHFGDLHWENGQLLVVTPLEKGERSKPLEGSTTASQFSMNAARQLAAKDHTLEGNDDIRATQFPLHVPAVETLDWLDDPLNYEGSMAMQRNNMLAGTHSYQVSEGMNSRKFLQQGASITGNPEGVAGTLCSPSIQSGLLNVDAGVNMPNLSSLQPSMIQEHLDKSSSAMLNSMSLHCMASSPMQLSQNTFFARSSGDAAVFSAPHIDLIPDLQGALNVTNSLASVDIGRPSDLESALLDSSELSHMSFSCGSGHSPNKGSKVGEVSGNKKSRASEDFDSESEGSYDDAVALKKPRLGQSALTKRTRAADTHNQSERNRRGRINEKLKALQELIPNANKTDKASVLSEAIDYLKKLRLQLQVMCCRNGMNISPLLNPQGIHQPQVPLTGTGMSHGTEAATAFGVNAASASFSLPPNVGSSVQACLGSMGLPEMHALAEAPFTSMNALHPSGIPASYGPTALTTPDSFHHPFQV